jgi:hypothetical protein
MRLTLRDPYDVPPEGFWSMFFDAAYNQALYREGLGFESLEVLEDTVGPDGVRRRRLKVRPRLELPGPVRRLIGDTTGYTEEGTFDPKAGTFTTRIIPAALSDRVRIDTVMRVEPRGTGSERVADVDIGVRVLGVGGIFEKFVERTMRESYAKAAAFSNRWLAKR